MMDKVALKKWTLLGGLLLLTLVLVWQAPEPERAEVIEAKKPASDRPLPRSTPAPGPSDNTELRLKPRQQVTQTIDLFSVPTVAKPKPVVRPVKRPEKTAPQKRVELPFDYIGKFQSEQKTTFFLMEGSRLYLVHEGDTINEQFRLDRIDQDANELVWSYLPSNETRKLSMDR